MTGGAVACSVVVTVVTAVGTAVVWTLVAETFVCGTGSDIVSVSLPHDTAEKRSAAVIPLKAVYFINEPKLAFIISAPTLKYITE
jgi:hypothetical protein